MATRLEFIAIGEQPGLTLPNLRRVPLADKHARHLYARRLEAMRACTADYLCFVDGDEDVLLPGFADAMQALADTGAPIAYADELVHGVHRAAPDFTLPRFMGDHSIIHHGVCCRVDALRSIDWPTGSYAWEVIAYGTLAQRGFVHDTTPRYDYRPGPHGARLWSSYGIAVISSKRFLNGLPEVRFGK